MEYSGISHDLTSPCGKWCDEIYNSYSQRWTLLSNDHTQKNYQDLSVPDTNIETLRSCITGTLNA